MNLEPILNRLGELLIELAGVVEQLSDAVNNSEESAQTAVTEGKSGGEQKGNKSKKKAQLTDQEWITTLKASPAYEGIEIDREYAKMIHWCETKGKKPSRARFVNWLNKAEVPMRAAPILPPGVIRGQKPPEHSAADGWNKERFKKRIDGKDK